MPGIDYTLGMKTSGFDTGVSGALGKLANLGKAAAAATAAAGVGAAAGIGVLISKSIGKAADMETLQTAFIPLLGGIQQAKDRIAELSQFAAATPFELPVIAAASKTLETLTRGALSTGKGLTLVGDLASATGQPFSDLATTVGRLYDGLQSGRPVGEVLMRLQELGAITGETRAKLEASGGGAEAWATAEAALSRFSGSMKLQSTTWNGLMSTLKDTISVTMAQFGAPIMDSLKPYLEGATSQIESFQAAAVKVGEKIGSAVGLVRHAFQDGKLMELAGQSLKLGFMEAVNMLAKGVQAAVLGIGSALEGSGITTIFTTLFSGIGDLLSSKLKAAAADFMEAIGRSGAAADLRAGSKADANRSANYFTMTGAALSMADPAAGLKAGMDKFNEALANLPDLIDTTAARKSLEETLAPLLEQANADKAAREKAKQDVVAAVIKPPGAAAASPAAALARGTGGLPAADRLAQIGGYVGGAAKSMAQKAADATAKWTEATAKGIEKLIARPPSEASATF